MSALIQAEFSARQRIAQSVGRQSFVAAIEKSGKKKIVLSGLWTEICVALPTIQTDLRQLRSLGPNIAASATQL